MFSGCEHTTPLPAILVLGGQLRPSFSAGLTRTAVRCVRYSSMLAMISATLCTSVSSSSSRSAMVDAFSPRAQGLEREDSGVPKA